VPGKEPTAPRPQEGELSETGTAPLIGIGEASPQLARRAGLAAGDFLAGGSVRLARRIREQRTRRRRWGPEPA
jgi:hypothetical protein